MPCQRYHLTKHAIARYKERFDQCSGRDATDRLMHAAQISRPPTEKQRQWMQRRRVASRGTPARWCEIMGMMLICARLSDDSMIVKTVIPVPCDEQCRQDLRKRRSKHKEERKRAEKSER